MTPEAILLSIRDRAGEGSYRFACPTCLNTIEKPADRKVVALLLSAGVELAEGTRSRTRGGHELLAPAPEEERPQGPPLTIDDLINFHFLLADDAELYRALPRA
jgi:hypothetical protein